METILPICRPPWWLLLHEILIDNDKEAAVQRHSIRTLRNGEIGIYTDGSMINSHAGTAVHCPGLKVTHVAYMGDEKSQNIFVAEVLAIRMVAKMAIRSIIQVYTIYTDSKVAIIAIGKPTRQSDQWAIINAVNSVEALRRDKPDIRITITCTLSYTNIEGNEQADGKRSRELQILYYVTRPLKGEFSDQADIKRLNTP
jgi:hypothetical protein